MLYTVTDDNEVRCNTYAALAQYVSDGGWDTVQQFEEEMGITYEDLKGKLFTVVGGRLYLQD